MVHALLPGSFLRAGRRLKQERVNGSWRQLVAILDQSRLKGKWNSASLCLGRRIQHQRIGHARSLAPDARPIRNWREYGSE